MTAPEAGADTHWLAYSCALVTLYCAVNVTGFLDTVSRFIATFLITFILMYGLANMVITFVQSYESNKQAFQESLKALDGQDSRRDYERIQRVRTWRDETAPLLTWGADGDLEMPARKKLTEEKKTKKEAKLRMRLAEILTPQGQ